MVTRSGFGVLVVVGHVAAITVGFLGAKGIGLSALATVGLIGLLVFVGWENDSPTGGTGNGDADSARNAPDNRDAAGTRAGGGGGSASGASDAARRDGPMGGAVSEE